MKNSFSLKMVIAVSFFMTSLFFPQENKKETESINPKSTKELVNEMKGEKDGSKKQYIYETLRKKLPQTEEEIKMFVDLLEDKDDESKLVAMQVLGNIKERNAVPKIISLLKSKNIIVQIGASAALGEIGDERAIDALLENPDLMQLEFGGCPIAKIGAPALPKLIEAARKKKAGWFSSQEKTDKRREKSISAISQIKDEKAVPILMNLLKDQNTSLRLAAVRALAAMKAPEAEAEFENMLSDKDKRVQDSVLGALVKADKDKYIKNIYEKLDSKEDHLSRTWAIQTLGRLKDPASVVLLEKLLNDKDESVRHFAAASLWKITGKAYKYKKDRILISERRYKQFIRDSVYRGESKKSQMRLLDDYKEQGYLLEYSIDDLLKELKESDNK